MSLLNRIFGDLGEEEGKKEQLSDAKLTEKSGSDDEIAVAIATAIHLFTQEVHDDEKYVLTINRIQKPYSPWSSKIYGLRVWPKLHRSF
ncbi:MAG: hypothetical protein JW917_02085 [Ignavibacteria bacterium]|nr:hypothetical protein [Ignavibacteria bacterium]